MNKKSSNRNKKAIISNIFGVLVVSFFIIAFSLVGSSHQANAVFTQGGDKSRPATSTTPEKSPSPNSNSPTPTPTATGNNSNGNDSPEGNDDGTGQSPSNAKESIFDQTPWLVGGGIVLLVALGGLVWYTKKRKKKKIKQSQTQS